MKVWNGCYNDGWKDLITPESFAHPAKMAYGLLKRILAHIACDGWIAPGGIILDPFAGIGSTLILGAYEGYQVVGVELENRFVDLAQQNIDLHAKKLAMLGCPQPMILQGDSRKLCEIVAGADCIVSSPPYSEAHKAQESPGGICDTNRKDLKKWVWTKGTQGETEGNLGAMKPGSVDAVVSSPPFQGAHSGSVDSASLNKGACKRPWLDKATANNGYGHSPGQLGAMKPGSVDAVVSSPPYAEQQEGGGIAASVRGDSDYSVEGGPARTKKAARAAKGFGYQGQGQTPSNLGNLKPGDVEAIISSPPYEGSIQTNGDGIDWSKIKDGGTRKTEARAAIGAGYGKTNGQLAQEQGDTFWYTARIIIEQCYQILKPAGVAIFVVKAFVRKGKIVDFPGDWRRLCESVGFETLHEHHAMLYKEDRFTAFWGEEIIDRTNHDSFFRTLTNNKAGWAAYWKVVPKAEQQDWLVAAKLKLPQNKPKHTILGKAQELAFKDTAERIWDWNEHVRIDYETVLCIQKAGQRALFP